MKKVFDAIEDRAGGGILEVGTQAIGALSVIMFIDNLGGELTILNRLRAADAFTAMYNLAIHGGGGNGKQTVGFNITQESIRFSFVIAATNDVRILMFDEPITPFGAWPRALANPVIAAAATDNTFADAPLGAFRGVSVHVSGTEVSTVNVSIARAGLKYQHTHRGGRIMNVEDDTFPRIFENGITFDVDIKNLGAGPDTFPTVVMGHF